MLTDTTVNKLNEMKLTTMSRVFKEQLSDPNISKLSFEDRFGLLVDQEWASRKNNHLKRLIKRAKFAEYNACTENIEYHSDRNLDAAQITRLAACEYINEHHNILLLGATGSGKTYIACALGMAAVRRFLEVRYARLPELLTELAVARGNGTYRKVIQQYKKPALLILDEWLLYPLTETEARDLLEIAEARYKKASTIFCSQFDVPGWREKIGDPIRGSVPPGEDVFRRHCPKSHTMQEVLFMKTTFKRSVSVLLSLLMVLSAAAVGLPGLRLEAQAQTPAAGETVTVVACSDYQYPNTDVYGVGATGNAGGEIVVGRIASQMKSAGFDSADGFL